MSSDEIPRFEWDQLSVLKRRHVVAHVTAAKGGGNSQFYLKGERKIGSCRQSDLILNFAFFAPYC